MLIKNICAGKEISKRLVSQMHPCATISANLVFLRDPAG